MTDPTPEQIARLPKWAQHHIFNQTREIDRLDDEVERLTTDLAECFRLSGADPDGNEDWRLAPHAVREVARLRREHDELVEVTP